MTLRDQELKTSVRINAPAEIIWNILTDFKAYPRWNPFTPYVHGEAQAGAVVFEVAYIAPGVFLPIAMEVIACEPGRELAWRGKAPHWFAAISLGEHHFTIRPIPEENGVCEFTHYALLRGIVMQLGANHIQKYIKPIHEARNRALKERAEAWVAPKITARGYPETF